VTRSGGTAGGDDVHAGEATTKFFIHPKNDWQRRYEALRASFVDRIPARVVAERFGYSAGYIHLLRHQFRSGKFDFAEPPADGQVARRRVTRETRSKIREWRERGLAAGEIAQLLSEDGAEISVRTVERVLAEEGFSRLPRRTRLKTGMTVKGASVPKKAQRISLAALDGLRCESPLAGIFVFAPFLAQLDIAGVVRQAGLPGTKMIPAINYILSFLALKLLGNERFAHVGDHAFDPGLGVFTGLNVIPKCTAMSTYSYGLDAVHIQRLQSAFVKRATKLALYGGKIINLDFHTVPHFGDESVLEKHWAGSRNKVMKGALTLVAQDAESKLIVYTQADIRKNEADDQILDFLEFWWKVRRGVDPTLVFDSRFTTYAHLSALNAMDVKFITLRRRGNDMIRKAGEAQGFKTIHIPHEKRKYPNPQAHESIVNIDGYDGDLRQITLRGTGREKPTFIITNDFEPPTEVVVGNYARRWRVENVIAEAVKFFHINAMSSPILVKVAFDVALTMVADTLYTMLATKLRGFEECDAPKLHRHFIDGKGTISVKGTQVQVAFRRRAHHPVLRNVPWARLPRALPAHPGAELTLHFS
jgi:transposase